MIKDEQIKTLEEENIKIEGLEDDILRLTNLTQEQRQKILNAYLKFAPNKPLLKELITTCLEYQKAKKNNKLTPKELKFLRKKLEEIRNNLEEEVGEELFEEINSIINDCEDLVR
jgi:hypothetical protein